MVIAIFIFSIAAAFECCMTITFPKKVMEFIWRFEEGDADKETIKQEPLALQIFAAVDLLVRLILPVLLLLSPFERFRIYAWIFIAEFLTSDIILSKVGKKYYLMAMVFISALELCIFADIIRSCFFALWPDSLGINNYYFMQNLKI